MIKPLRLCEYDTCRVEWDDETREVVAAAAQSWAGENSLPQPPLSFEGADGRTLRAEQHVGVVEAGGVCVEIYPKLDAELVRGGALDENRVRCVMGNLLWLLEESGFGGLVDAGEASVEDCPDNIADLLAWLFARRLRHQLSLGAPREYLTYRDDLPLVRGRIQFARQATALFSRPDVIACEWDEFSPDTPLARLLRCATEALLARTRLPGAAADLRDVLAMLDEVEPVHPLEALGGNIRWSRLNTRWRPCHDLAVAALRGLGRALHAGAAESFVFLLDMNRLFESYCTRWLERRFDVPIAEQVRLGTLLTAPAAQLGQDADFVWHTPGVVWVGDAKYKRIGADGPAIDDVRQLICYGQLARERYAAAQSRLMILHPTTDGERAEESVTFDGQPLRLQSVRVVKGAA